MAIDWAPSLERGVGSRELIRIFRLLRDGVIPRMHMSFLGT